MLTSVYDSDLQRQTFMTSPLLCISKCQASKATDSGFGSIPETVDPLHCSWIPETYTLNLKPPSIKQISPIRVVSIPEP